MAVEQAVFCLHSETERRGAAESAYLLVDTFLRVRSVRDFRFVLVPANSAAPSARKALAIGSDGRLRLTARGRRCSDRD